MTSTSNGDSNVRKHSLLDETEAMYRKTYLDQVFRTGGRRWLLRTLEVEDENWADGRVVGETLFAAGAGRRAPIISAALLAIGPDTPTPAGGGDEPRETEAELKLDLELRKGLIPVEELFALEPSAADLVKDALKDPATLKRWRRAQVLAWFESGAVPAEIISQLYNGYLSLRLKRTQMLEALGPFEISPLGDALRPTSLREKGS